MGTIQKHIVVEGQMLQISFSEVLSPQGKKYFIQSKTKQGKEECFEMKKTGFGNWQVIQPAATWVLGAEKDLANVINSLES